LVLEITSPNNEHVRRVQALQRSTRRRSREKLMVAEGTRLVEEALASKLPIEEAFYTADFAAAPEGQAILTTFKKRQIRYCHVPEDLMMAMSDTETPQGILVVLPTPEIPPAAPGFILVPDNIRDPGNLGTMLRTAWATNVSQVLLPPGNVDVTNPKVVRAGMGAHFYVSTRPVTWAALREMIAFAKIWLAEMREGVPYSKADWHENIALIIGGEATGAGPEARALAQHHVYIPMAPGVDSLNAAIAAAILMFEVARQQSRLSPPS